MNTEVKPKRVHDISDMMVEVNYLEKIRVLFGDKKAASMIGTASVRNVIHEGKTRQYYELAAKHVWMEHQISNKKDPSSYVIKLNDDHKKIILPLLETLNVPHLGLDF